MVILLKGPLMMIHLLTYFILYAGALFLNLQKDGVKDIGSTGDQPYKSQEAPLLTEESSWWKSSALPLEVLL